MSKAAHTPGPWVKDSSGVLRGSNGHCVDGLDPINDMILEMINMRIAQMSADRALRDNALELLEALERLIELFMLRSLSSEEPEEEQAVINARAAIAKATGGEHA